MGTPIPTSLLEYLVGLRDTVFSQQKQRHSTHVHPFAEEKIRLFFVFFPDWFSRGHRFHWQQAPLANGSLGCRPSKPIGFIWSSESRWFLLFCFFILFLHFVSSFFFSGPPCSCYLLGVTFFGFRVPIPVSSSNKGCRLFVFPHVGM